jgi:hypothetical protein
MKGSHLTEFNSTAVWPWRQTFLRMRFPRPLASSGTWPDERKIRRGIMLLLCEKRPFYAGRELAQHF